MVRVSATNWGAASFRWEVATIGNECQVSEGVPQQALRTEVEVLIYGPQTMDKLWTPKDGLHPVRFRDPQVMAMDPASSLTC